MASILVVDDDVEVGEVLRRVLERGGFAVRVVNSAAAALAAVAASEPDVVITDVIMPRQNGVDLIGALRTQSPRIRIVAISGGGSFGPSSYKPDAISTHAYLAAARQAGASEVLSKPFDMSDLLNAVRGVLTN
ncbi:MAG TPA: response regulator [Steroidobacteraceae bacterium]|nr:response regulator [Steroidobacteraceae bacterium]